MRNRRTFNLVVAIFICFVAVNVRAQLIATPKPAPPPASWRGLIGEYGADDDILIILEKDGRLFALIERKDFEPLVEVSQNVFQSSASELRPRLIFKRDSHGRATQ